MKKAIFLKLSSIIFLITIYGCLSVNGQSSSSENERPKIDYKYAELMIRWNGFGKWMTTELDLGTMENIVDKKSEELQNNVRKMKNSVDFMNYMNDEGWEYMDKETTRLTNTSWCMYTFRKPK